LNDYEDRYGRLSWGSALETVTILKVSESYFDLRSLLVLTRFRVGGAQQLADEFSTVFSILRIPVLELRLTTSFLEFRHLNRRSVHLPIYLYCRIHLDKKHAISRFKKVVSDQLSESISSDQIGCYRQINAYLMA
jgi:hypothetical protein